MANGKSTDKCECFGTGYDPEVKECQACDKNHHSEFVQCKTATESLTKEKVKEEKVEPTEEVVEQPNVEPAKEMVVLSKVEPTEEVEGESETEGAEVTPGRKKRKKVVGVDIRKVCRDLLAGGNTDEVVLAAVSAEYAKVHPESEKYCANRAKSVLRRVRREDKAKKQESESSEPSEPSKS